MLHLHSLHFSVGVPWFSVVFSRTSVRAEVIFRCLCSICDKRGHAEPLTFRAEVHALNHFKRLLSSAQLDFGDPGTKPH